MADAPELVPDSLSPGVVSSPENDEREDGSEAPILDEKKAVISPEQRNSQEEKEFRGFENEESNPKFGYAHDDRAGSGLERLRNPTADQKVAGELTACRTIQPTDPEAATPQGQISKPEDEWHYSFWDCFSPSSLCIESLICPCVLTGRTHTRLHSPTDAHFVSSNAYCFSCCALSLTSIAALPLYCFMTSAQRREIRYRYHIKGNNGEDCFKATFCVCCALVQEEKEVVWRIGQAKKREEEEQLRKREDKMEYKSE